jgi:tetratricopeptide (TPR) repeat protein
MAATLVLFVVALALHALVWSQYRSDPFAGTPVSDALSYHVWAQRIAQEGLRPEPVFHQSPLFPVLLGWLYRSTGERAALFMQAVLLSAAIALLVPLGRLYMGSASAGMAAAVIALLHGPFVFHAMKLLPIPLALATQALALLLLARARESGRSWLALLCGAAWGLAALARSEILLFLPVALAALWWRKGTARRWITPVCCLCGALLTVAPATFHNVRRGDFVVIASAAGENLYIGNQRDADGGHTPLHPKAGDLFSQRALAEIVAERELDRELRPSEISAHWRAKAVGEILASPAGWLGLELKKLARVVSPGDPTDMYSYPLERDRYLPALHALPLPPLALLLLGAAGMYAGLRSNGRRCWPLAALPALHAAVLMVFFVSTRLRLPLLFFLAPFAGLAVVEGIRCWKAGRRRIMAAGAAVVVILAIAHWMAVIRPSPREIVRLASVLSTQNRLDESLEVLEPAIREPDPDPHALDQAGWVLSKKGDYRQAREHYIRALEAGLAGARATQTRSRLADVHERLGEFDLAAAMHDAAVANEGASAGTFYARAAFRMRRGDPEGAKQDIERAEELRRLEVSPGPPR